MEFSIKTEKREEVVDITKKVEEIVDRAGDEDSKACLIFVPHTTCSLIISEDNGVYEDLIDFLDKLIPRGKWEHDKTDNNADAHLKSNILGSHKLIPIDNGKLVRGEWQNICLAEFDGPRERRVIVKII
ncbi:YjbQ family protein [Candidatus Pacearchaeota archaeon]|nr:YjbQ family protein [Candidatus Pacearchaeota archaeon]